MIAATNTLITNIAEKYFEDFSLKEVQDFFSIAITASPSLEDDVKQATTPGKLQTVLADAVKAIETQAAGTYAVNTNLMKAMNSLKFSD